MATQGIVLGLKDKEIKQTGRALISANDQAIVI